MERKTQDQQARSEQDGGFSQRPYYAHVNEHDVTADRRHDATELGFGCYRTNTHLEAA